MDEANSLENLRMRYESFSAIFLFFLLTYEHDFLWVMIWQMTILLLLLDTVYGPIFQKSKEVGTVCTPH